MSFKFNVGDSSRISMDVTPFHEGWTYFTTDGEYYADIVVDGENKRVRVKGDSGSATGGREIAVTLAADGWTDGKQSIAIEGLTADQSGIISVAQSATVEEEDAAATARLKIFSQEAGELTIWAVNGAPTCDVPVQIVLFEESLITPPPPQPKIYGAEWDGGLTTAWARTDDAVGLADPIPAVNNGTGSSPFDSIMPWAGMVRVTDEVAGELVAIPKFYYKWTQNGDALKLQISDGWIDGFYTSPAHADRGDGIGERDVVYVGRYHCANSYRSEVTEVGQHSLSTRSNDRANIHNLGIDVWQFDYAMLLTIQMLYLVEFADWDSQNKIGWGGTSNNSYEANGATDGMLYHTGTIMPSRTQYGGIQYRYIEGLWSHIYDWVDGCYFNNDGFNIISNPSLFSDSSGGILVGKPPESYSNPSSFVVPTIAGLEWAIYPDAINGTASDYTTDSWIYNPSNSCLLCGSYYYPSLQSGLFHIESRDDSFAHQSIGCRLMKLPN